MAILTQSGRAAMAQAVKNQKMHVAWGTGDAAWDSEPIPEDTVQEALKNEVGRRVVDEVFFCVPDDQGEYEASNGRFSMSEAPTRN
ncbi:MAG: phage tail protein, partial [Holosporaceae bacterium]|nr:phage tail protein [Holosporaceae bacterium]